MKLTDKFLKAIKGRETRYEVSDGGGLSVRVTPNGQTTFQYRFRIAGGKQQRMDFGSYPDISLAQARELHRIARNRVAMGENPLEERKEGKRAESRAMTVAQLVADFMTKEIRPKRKRPQYAESLLMANVVPTLGKRKAKDITKRDIVEMLERIVARDAPVMANRVGSITKQMFSFAQMRGLLEHNPCNHLTRTSIGGAEKPREMFLSYAEIHRFWHGLDKVRCTESFKYALRILLATGQRRGELFGGKWEHVNLNNKIWTIPAEFAKNGKEHHIHLSPLAESLFKQLKLCSGGSKYLVPSPVADDDVSVSERAVNRVLQRNAEKLCGKGLSPHVLRHTFSTHLTALAVAPHVVEKLLNHQLTGMFAVYNHYQYFSERKLAMQLWSETLKSIIDAPTVNDLPLEPGSAMAA